MGFIKNFQIVFDNQWSTYYSGQQVSGKVLISVENAKKIRAITIKLKGCAAVAFSERHTRRGHDGKTEHYTVHYSASESYFETRYDLTVGERGNEFMLPVGDHCYPFTTVLPQRLPSSFEGKHGHVRYTAKVTVDIPWKFDKEVKSAFTVISPLDLNLDPTAKFPVKQTKEKYFGCWCCKSAPLSLTASLPATGFVSGQKIPIVIEVDNTSDQPVSYVTCKLKKIMWFHAHYPNHHSKKSYDDVAEISMGPVNANGSACWAEHLTVPPLPPSNLANCSIIDVNYELELEAHVQSCCHRNLHLTIPVYLGTIPLMQNYAEQPVAPLPVAPPQIQYPTAPYPDNIPGPPPHSLPPPYPTTPYSDTKPDSLPPPYPTTGGMGWHQPGMHYPELPPPSFEQAMYGATTIRDDGDSEHVKGDDGFTPRYPSYNFQPSAPPL